MQDFFAKKAWDRPGVPRLHVLAIPQPKPPVERLQRRSVLTQAAKYQAALEGQPGLLLVPPEWLHLTVWGPGLYQDEVEPERLEKTIGQLRDALLVNRGHRRYGPRVLTGPALVGRSNIRLDVDPPDELASLMGTCDITIRSWINGPDADLPRVMPPVLKWRPHITIAYCAEDTDACDPHVVNEVNGGRVEWEITELHVVGVPRPRTRLHLGTDRLDPHRREHR